MDGFHFVDTWLFYDLIVMVCFVIRIQPTGYVGPKFGQSNNIRVSIKRTSRHILYSA